MTLRAKCLLVSLSKNYFFWAIPCCFAYQEMLLIPWSLNPTQIIRAELTKSWRDSMMVSATCPWSLQPCHQVGPSALTVLLSKRPRAPDGLRLLRGAEPLPRLPIQVQGLRLGSARPHQRPAPSLPHHSRYNFTNTGELIDTRNLQNGRPTVEYPHPKSRRTKECN